MNLMLPAASLRASRQGRALLLQEASSRQMLLGTLESTDGCGIKKKQPQKSPVSGVRKGSSLMGREWGRGWRCSELSPASP